MLKGKQVNVYTPYKKDFVNTRPRGRPPKRWTDIIRPDTVLPLLTAGRNASDRNGWRRRNVERAGGQLT